MFYNSEIRKSFFWLLGIDRFLLFKSKYTIFFHSQRTRGKKSWGQAKRISCSCMHLRRTQQVSSWVRKMSSKGSRDDWRAKTSWRWYLRVKVGLVLFVFRSKSLGKFKFVDFLTYMLFNIFLLASRNTRYYPIGLPFALHFEHWLKNVR